MKTCKLCNKPFEKTSPRANNKKFCSIECRQEHYRQQPEYKERYDKANREKYNQYAKGKIQCKECGGYYHMIGGHVRQVHSMTAREYKKKHGLDLIKGVTSAQTHELKSSQVFENPHVIENIKEKGKATRFTKGDKRAGRYTRSKQTRERLKLQRERYLKTKRHDTTR